MTIIIDDLPIPGENKTTPNFDQRDTDILFLALEDNMLQNPVGTDLGEATSDFATSNGFLTGSGNLTQASLTTAISDVTLTPTTILFTPAIKAQMITDLGTIKTCTAVYSSGGLTQLAVDGSSGLLDHTDLVIRNIGAPDGAATQMLAFPNSITTEIPGELPADFPGFPSLDGLTNFGGLPEVSAIPELGLPDLDAIPALPNLGDLPGVNLPGVPDPTAVLSAVSGTVLAPEFGGISTDLAGNACAIAAAGVAGFSPLNTDVSGVLGAVDGDALAELAPSLNVNTTTLVPGLDALAPSFGDMGGGLNDALLGEQDALFAGGCSTLSTVASTGCGSSSAAMAETSTVTNALKTSTGASLIASTATPELDSVLGGFS